MCSVVPANDRLALVIEHLEPFPLADRVIAQDGHAVFRQQDACALIGIVRLGIVAVPARQEHARKGMRAFRNVKVRRYMVVGPTLEKNLFDSVAVASQFTDDARVERRTFGEVAERMEKKLTKFFLSPGNVGWCLDRGDCLAPGVEMLACLVEQVAV